MNASIANQPPTPLSAGQLQPVSPFLLSHPIIADRALSVSAQLVAPVACVSDLLPEARSLTAARRGVYGHHRTPIRVRPSLYILCFLWFFGIRCVSQKSFLCSHVWQHTVQECVSVFMRSVFAWPPGLPAVVQCHMSLSGSSGSFAAGLMNWTLRFY